jgi:hypothetical protein
MGYFYITQFSQQFRIDINDRPSLTDHESKSIKPFSVSRGISSFLTAVADVATSRSRPFFLDLSSFCSPSQSTPQFDFIMTASKYQASELN